MFLYFTPGRNTIGRDQLAELGLAYALDRECHFHACGVSGSGPGGRPGVVFAVSTADDPGASAARCKVDLAAQVWREIPRAASPETRDPVWVGHWRDALPGPADLARGEQLAGHWLELLDGQQWRIPMARGWSEADNGEQRWRVLLPQRLDLAADGRWIHGPVVARYQPLWELCEAYLNVRSGASDPRLEGQSDIDAAVLCLQANYRLGRVEAALLGILSEDLVSPILDCLIDWPGWLAYLKKKAPHQSQPASPSSSASDTPPSPPAGSPSSGGPAAAIAPTAPPEPT